MIPAPHHRPRPVAAAFALALAFATTLSASPPTPQSAATLLQELRSLQQAGTVLYVAAHPDDENTRLIGWLARGRGYRTGYISVTRGDGGQNLIGPELREGLGVIRTQELLAARRIDGGEQFFTRAVDFGYSKTSAETLEIWDRDAVLRDMVRVIRMFQPDVIITRFSPGDTRTHGHHTSSAILAVEAFKLAADPKADAPEFAGLPPWQPKRVVWNAFRWGARANDPVPPDTLRLDVGGYNAVLGESFGEIAARSRSMHKSQGFGVLSSRGPASEEFHLLAGEPMAADIMDGVDTRWARLPGGGELDRLIAEAVTNFHFAEPARNVPALLEIRRRLHDLPDQSIVLARRAQLDRLLLGCLGLYVETTIASAEVVPGEKLALKHTVVQRAGSQPVRWVETRYPLTHDVVRLDAELQLNQPHAHEGSAELPRATPLTQPYWLREPGTLGMFRVDDVTLIGRPENPPAFPVEHVFVVDGETIIVPDAPVQVIDDPVRGEVRHPLEVVAPVSVAFGDDLALFSPGATREVTVEVTTLQPGTAGVIALTGLDGWKVSPAEHAFQLPDNDTRTRVRFQVTAPRRPTTAFLQAEARVGGATWGQRRSEIHYEHIPPQILQPPAQLQAVSLDVEVRAKSIGYLPGAGDAVADSLRRLGCEVTILSDADLTRERLRAFDAVVLGVRAFNTRTGLAPQVPALFAYAETGGTVVVQYNTTADLKTSLLAPFRLKLSRDRITDENAAVTLLAPEHPALTTPNRITEADFAGWVQERGLYFPDEWDAAFTPLLGMSDPGEDPTRGALLVAQHGEGWYVYTGLSFFRELPAGVPGAYRLLANLVSLGE